MYSNLSASVNDKTSLHFIDQVIDSYFTHHNQRAVIALKSSVNMSDNISTRPK